MTIGTSETGYLNDDLVIDWLRHFIEHTRTKRREAWLLLCHGARACSNSGGANVRLV